MQAKSFKLLRTRRESPLFADMFSRAIYSYLLQLDYYNVKSGRYIKLSINKISQRLGISRHITKKSLTKLEGLGLVQVVADKWIVAEQHDEHFYKKAVEHPHYFNSYAYDTIKRPENPQPFKVNIAYCVMKSRKERNIKYTIRGMCRILGLDRTVIRKADKLIGKSNVVSKVRQTTLEVTCGKAAAAIAAACLHDEAEESTILSSLNVIVAEMIKVMEKEDIAVVINTLAKDFGTKKPKYAADAFVDYVENHYQDSLQRVFAADPRSLPAALLTEIRGALGFYLKQRHNLISGMIYPPVAIYNKPAGLLPRQNCGYWNKI